MLYDGKCAVVVAGVGIEDLAASSYEELPVHAAASRNVDHVIPFAVQDHGLVRRPRRRLPFPPAQRRVV